MIYDNTYLNYFPRGRATLEVAKNRTRPLPVAGEGSVKFREIRAERMNMRTAMISNGVNLSSPWAPFFPGHAVVSLMLKSKSCCFTLRKYKI